VTVLGLVGQIKGWLTAQQCHVATIVVHHNSRLLSLVFLPKSETVEDVLAAERAFEGSSCTTGAKALHYHAADNGRMKDANQHRTVSVCRVNTHSRSGVAERRIRKLQDGAGTSPAKHHRHMGTTIIGAEMWPDALWHCKDVTVCPKLTHFPSSGCPACAACQVACRIPLGAVCHQYGKSSKAPQSMAKQGTLPKHMASCGVLQCAADHVTTIIVNQDSRQNILCAACQHGSTSKVLWRVKGASTDGGLSRAKQVIYLVAFLLAHETIAPLLSNQDKELQQLEGNPLAFDFKGSSVPDAVCCHETMKEPCAHLFPVSVAGEANNRFVPCDSGRQGVQVLKIDVKIEGAHDDQTTPRSLQPVFALRHVATIVVDHDSRQDEWQNAASLSAPHFGSSAARTASCRWLSAASFSAPHANMATLTGAVDCFRRPPGPARSSVTTCSDRIPMMDLLAEMQGMGHVEHDKPTDHCKPFKRPSGAIAHTRLASYWYTHRHPIAAAWHPFQSCIMVTLRHSVLSTPRHSSVVTSPSKSPWRTSSASATSCSHSERRSERILGFDHVCSHDLSRVQSRSRTRNNAGTSARPLENQRPDILSVTPSALEMYIGNQRREPKRGHDINGPGSTLVALICRPASTQQQ
jgi:hypothetical protein